jgi:hypothetical protein
MNPIQWKVLTKKMRERLRTLQGRHNQPVINKVLTEAVEQSNQEELMVPKTSSIKTETLSQPAVKKDASTKPLKGKSNVPNKPRKKSKPSKRK